MPLCIQKKANEKKTKIEREKAVMSEKKAVGAGKGAELGKKELKLEKDSTVVQNSLILGH